MLFLHTFETRTLNPDLIIETFLLTMLPKANLSSLLHTLSIEKILLVLVIQEETQRVLEKT
jgi:hypothetical protein